MMGFDLRAVNMVESVSRHTEAQLRTFIRRMGSLGFNTLVSTYDYGWKRFGELILEETYKQGIEYVPMVNGPRTFFSYVDWKPSWFAKKADGTPFTESLGCDTKPCAAEPEAVEAYKYGAKCWLESLPKQIKLVHVRCSDGLFFCECPSCSKLPEYDRWQPFVNTFVDALEESRPDLGWETDVYVKRYFIPSDFEIYKKAGRIMYDVWGRNGRVPLGQPSADNHGVRDYCYSHNSVKDASTVNEWHIKRLAEWSKFVPGKVYVHENLMAQALSSVNQHNTAIMLKDQRTFRDLGIRGVMYEAYELGYESFAEQIEVLASAMRHPEVIDEYKPSACERELAKKYLSMRMFCDNMNFPIDKYIDDPILRQHTKNYCHFLNDPNLENLRNTINFVFKHEKRFDALHTGFRCCKVAANTGGVNFSTAQKETIEMLSHNKLWDYIETIPLEKDPISICKDLIFGALKNAYKKDITAAGSKS